ncbi:MAG: TRAP transporter large permease subunit, partial [Candidatus Asgardarchaeum sp.]
IAMSSAFSYALTTEQLGSILTNWLSALNVANNPLLFLFGVNIVLLVLGMFMDSTATLIILTPFLVPLAQSMGIDLVFFGVLIVFNLMIGLSTPPYGMSLFTVARVAHLRVEEVISSIFPFIVVLIITLLLVTIFPALILWLPSLIYT